MQMQHKHFPRGSEGEWNQASPDMHHKSWRANRLESSEVGLVFRCRTRIRHHLLTPPFTPLHPPKTEESIICIFQLFHVVYVTLTLSPGTSDSVRTLVLCCLLKDTSICWIENIVAYMKKSKTHRQPSFSSCHFYLQWWP